MATGAALITHVCEQAKLNSTAASADRTRVLGWLQEAAEDLCLDAEVNVPAESSVSLTSGTDEYALGTAPFNLTGLLAISDLRITDSSTTNMPLDQVTPEQIDLWRMGSQATATPYAYSVDYPRLVLYPAPGAGATLKVRYIKSAPTLADDANNLTFIPDTFHYSTLAKKAMYHAMVYKNQPNAEKYLQMYDAGVSRLRKWKVRVGGINRAEPMVGTRRVTNPSQDTGMFN